ncbi:MAG: hypothetical protein PHH30_11215 [Bacteroidales bacterium]|nr:hypothetical protein [Bacteroidales bacterium]MDD3860877.1 hypothetical protein [Bacteroidales bacterium]
MKKIIYLILTTALFSCNNLVSEGEINNDKLNVEDTSINSDLDLNEINDTIVVIDEYFEDPIIKSYTSESDTLVVSENCVIFLWPDSLEIEEIKIKYPDGYAEILDDMIYYASDAAIALDNEGYKNFFCDKSVIQFKGDKKDIFIKRKKTDGNMILFKYGEKPVIMNAIDFEIDFCRSFFTVAVTDSVI